MRTDGDYGQDDEELFELAMHPEQYRNYKSGQAKKNFLADLQAAKDAKLGAKVSPEEAAAFKHAKADAIVAPVKGQLFWNSRAMVRLLQLSNHSSVRSIKK